ncbi:unnamed protein product [Heterobilharzia americana]|nr:unnamed protein product [Heterobilharzia americana]CAH8474970.1 unnamed protein product [Heterobilharzia americana]
MNWVSYYDKLEGWVREQYDGIDSSRRRLENSLLEQQKYLSANALALKKYKHEMGLLQSLYSRNNTNVSSSSQSDGQQSAHSRRYIIPHPCRRIAAECIDITIMMVLKLVMLYFIKNESSIVELAKGIGSDILSGVPEYRTLRRAHGWAKSEFSGKEFQVSSVWRLFFFAHMGAREEFLDFEMIILADQIGRFLSALLEAFLIRRSIFGSDPGGATLGKWLMNLKVVSCEEIIAFPDVVEVVPGADVGIIRALVRSLLKSTSFLTFFSFVCMMVFQYHRCTYDIIAGTLVVQPIPPSDRSDSQNEQRQQQQPQQQ